MACQACLSMEELNGRFLWLWAAAVLGLCAVCRSIPSGSRFSARVPAAAALLAVLGKGPGAVFRGLLGFCNTVIRWWNLAHEDRKLMFQTSVTADEIQAFSLILILLLTAILWWSADQNKMWPVCTVTLFWLILSLAIRQVSAAALGCLFLGIFFLWSGRITGGWNRRHFCWLLAIAVCIGIAVWRAPSISMTAVNDAREQMAETAHRIRYGDGALPDGDLRKAHEMLMENEKTLSVTTEQVKTLYLRGFVGGRYRDGGWEPLPASAYGGGQSGMLEWLKQQGADPTAQYAAYLRAAGEGEAENHVTIENVGADRFYLYLPYSSSGCESGTPQRDNTILSSGIFGQTNYEFTENAGSLPGELMQLGDWFSAPKEEVQTQYIQAESVYRDFVYENYLTVDAGLESLIRERFWQNQEDTGSVYTATDRIREVLREHMTYREKPIAAPEDQDPIRWFLTEGRVGNSAMFASAAVEAYRACGIPARYGEGYLLREERIVSEGGTRFELTDRDGHCWAEVYLDGMGWVPVDVTPGFYYDTYALQKMVENPSGIRRTAALEDNGTKDAFGSDPDGSSQTEEPESEPPSRYGAIALGGLLLLLLLLGMAVFGMESLRLARMAARRRKYRRYRPTDRVQLLCDEIGQKLKFMGIPVLIGWETDQTEALLQEKMPEIGPGEYRRVIQIMEKFLYGELELPPQEERTLRCFADKLHQGKNNLSLLKRLKARYSG